MCFTNLGKCHWIKVYKLPEGGRNSRGRPINNVIQLEEGEKVSAILAVREFPEDQYVFFATAQGMVKKSSFPPLKMFAAKALKLLRSKKTTTSSAQRKPAVRTTLCCSPTWAKPSALTNIGKNPVTMKQKMPISKSKTKDSDGLDDENAENALPSGKHGVRPSGRGSGGLRGMRLPADGKIVSLITFAPEAEQSDLQVLTATANGYGKRTPIADYSRKNKGGQGNIAINTGERNGDLVAATLVSETDDLMLITSGGVLIRTKVEQIRETGRAAAGVRLINLDEGETLVSLERVAEEAEDEAALESDAAENQVVEAEDTPSQES